MKTLTLLMLLPFYVLAQSSKTCSEPSNLIFDLNSISKCNVKDQKKNSPQQITTTKSHNRKSSSHYIRKKKSKKTALTGSNNSIELDFKTLVIPNISTQNEILFSVVEKTPSFPNSICKTKNELKCFNDNIREHFYKNFYPEKLSEIDPHTKVFIQFTIDIKGAIKNIFVKDNKKQIELEKEIKRILNKLPKLISGRHKGIPVNVKYSLPILFTAD